MSDSASSPPFAPPTRSSRPARSVALTPSSRPARRDGARLYPEQQAAIQTAFHQYGLLTAAQARRRGIGAPEVRRLLRRGDWQRVHAGVYAIRELCGQIAPEDRLWSVAMAAQLALGPAAFAGAETAARLWGLQGLPLWDGREIHMVIPALGAQRHVPGIALHSWDTDHGDVTTVRGVRLTAPGRTLRDTLLRVDRDTGVCLVDSALNQRLVRLDDLPRLDAANSGRRGCSRVRSWWVLADGRAQSALETRVRLICTDGGLPPTDLQHPFRDERGRLLAIADFWWEDRLLIGEADGIGPHGSPEVLARDRRRQNALQMLYPGTRIVRFTWSDLDRPDYIRSTVARARL